MATLCRYNPKVAGQAFNATTGKWVNIPQFPCRSIPALLAVLPKVVTDVAKLNAATAQQYAMKSDLYVSLPTELPYNGAPQVHTFQFEPLRVNNARFKSRVARGEMIMSDYRNGRSVSRSTSTLILGPLTFLGGFAFGTSGMPPGADLLGALRDAIRSYLKTAAASLQPGVYSDSRITSVQYHYDQYRTTGKAYYTLPPVEINTYPDRPDTTGVITEAYAAALTGQMDILTELVELPETMRFIFGSVTNIGDQFVHLQRKQRRLRRRARQQSWPMPKLLTRLAQAELTFRYAIMPIVYSVKDSMSLLEKYGYEFHRERAKEEVQTHFSDDYGDWTSVAVVRCLVKQKFDPDDAPRQLRKLIGANPVVTLYETTPLSFVLDWVVPVGDYLQSLTTPNAANETMSCVAIRTSQYCYKTTEEGATREIFVETYERDVINPLSHIGITVRPSMSYARWLDAASLSWLAVKQKLKLKS